MSKRIISLKFEHEKEIGELIKKNNAYLINTIFFILCNLFLVSCIYGLVLIFPSSNNLSFSNMDSYQKWKFVGNLIGYIIFIWIVKAIYLGLCHNPFLNLIYGRNVVENSVLYNKIVDNPFPKMYEEYLQKKINKHLEIKCINEKPLFYNEIILIVEDKKITFTFKPTKPKFMYSAIILKSYLPFYFCWILFINSRKTSQDSPLTYLDTLKKPIYKIFCIVENEENEENEETIYVGGNINVFKPFNGRVKLKKELLKIEEQLDLIAKIVEQKIS